MKVLQVFLYIMLFQVLAASGFAQEHYTEGTVRAVNYYRTNPGQFDNYMKYLRTNFLPQQEEVKKQGLILDYYLLLNQPTSQDDWDVAVVYVHKNFAEALDFNQSRDDKMKEIAERHYKTTDDDKIRDLAGVRLDMRKFLGVKYLREVFLKTIN
ncbi:MAG TPA: hypothetical protein VLN45_02350 [Ignavibacteriaceae bacterium]|nr:hypothetical protein [Ignavibacteriaceae bacterium]